jgi:GAF domain
MHECETISSSQPMEYRHEWPAKPSAREVLEWVESLWADGKLLAGSRVSYRWDAGSQGGPELIVKADEETPLPAAPAAHGPQWGDETAASVRRDAVQQSVRRLLSSRHSLDQTLIRVLRVMCEVFDFDIGGVWLAEPGDRLLRCEAIWHRFVPGLEEFAELCRVLTYGPGEGLHGRSWTSRQSYWIGDILDGPSVPRRRIAARAGLHTACGVPLEIGNRVLGDIEFFGTRKRPEDRNILDELAASARQISGFIRAARSEGSAVKSP